MLTAGAVEITDTLSFIFLLKKYSASQLANSVTDFKISEQNLIFR